MPIPVTFCDRSWSTVPPAVARLRLTSAAHRDLSEIRAYGNERFGADAADRYFLGLDAAFAFLEDHPRAGPARPEWGDGIWCLTHRRHHILYQADGGEVLIVRIVHHARDVSQVLRR